MITLPILFVCLLGAIALLGVNVSCSDVPVCSQPCDGTQKSMFKIGHTYVYNYKANSYSYINVTNKENLDVNNTTIKLSAEIDLNIMTSCHIIMKIHNASFQNVDGDAKYNKDFTDALTKNEIRLHYVDGNIRELCAVKSEPFWVLNIKRGILSMLQFDYQNGTSNYTTTEKNIWGTCKTDYTTGEVDGWKTLKRKKTYKDCLLWEGQEMQYENHDFYQREFGETLDLFKNTQMCKYILGNLGQPVQITCKERQKFHPHASKVNLAVSNVTQHLDLDRVVIKEYLSNNEDEEFVSENITISFTKQDDEVLNFNTLQEFLDKIHTMRAEQLSNIIKSHNFNALIRNASYEVILKTIHVFEYQFKTSVRDLIDVIMQVKSTGSINVTKYLKSKNLIDDYQMVKWINSFPFIKYPNKQLLQDAKSLLHLENADLALSGLVLNFCRNTPNCTDDESVKYFTNYSDFLLKTHLRNFNQRNLTSVLLAIGNTGLTNFVPLIGEIITKTSHPPMLRMVAIESLRKMSCSDKTKYFKQAFTRWTDNAEVRIAAYLALCKCPSDDIIHHISVSLNVEGINEVTTFIWDHFKKSKTLPEAWKDRIANFTQDSFLKTEFMTYIPNYSKYYEHYLNFSAFNSSVKLSSVNVYKNTLPWSAYVKFSFGLFGNDVDKIEVFGHARDVNGIIESLFPRKRPSIEDKKYSSSDESISNNIVSIEDNLRRPISEERLLQSGLMVIRVADVDLHVSNPFDVSYKLLEIIRQSSNMFKNILDEESLGSVQMIYQFPTSVGYVLKYDITSTCKSGFSLMELQKNYKSRKVSKFNTGFSFIYNTQMVINGVISHDAYFAKPESSGSFVFEMQAGVKAEAYVLENVIQKFSFDLKPLLSDGKMFNVAKIE